VPAHSQPALPLTGVPPAVLLLLLLLLLLPPPPAGTPHSPQ
jgi:hypothetical protein